MRQRARRIHWGLAAACLLGGATGTAQQSAFQSSDGKTSLYLGSGGAVTFNLGDTKFAVGHQFHVTNKPRFYGYEVFGKASSGTTTLFSSKIKVPEGGGDFFLGWHWDGNNQRDSCNRVHHEDENSARWFLFDVGYSRSSFYVSDTAVPIDNAKRYFDRFRTMAIYNNRPNGWFLYGVAVGAERRNNLDDLKQISFETTLIAAPQNTTTAVVKTQAGYLGKYREYVAAPVYTDLLFILPEKVKVPGVKSRIAIDAFTRSDVAAANRYGDGGVGIFVTKKGAPTKVMGGIAASWNGGKGRVALVASYNF